MRAILTALLVLGLAMTGPARADDDDPATIRITGEGAVSAVPDIASVSVGVETTADEAAAALSENSEAMGRTIAALEASGIGARDRQTSGLSVQPVYTRPDRGEARELSGYRVVNQLSVTVRDLDSLGGVLDALVSAGANRLGSIDFRIEEPAPLLDEARRAAVADARRAAEAYAGAAGVSLGPVLSISEGGGRPEPRPHAGEVRALAAAVPVERGEETLRASVTIVWALETDDD